jgi:hypothetical protein
LLGVDPEQSFFNPTFKGGAWRCEMGQGINEWSLKHSTWTGVKKWVRGIRFFLAERLLEFRLFSEEEVSSSYLHGKAISIGDPQTMSCIHQSALCSLYR